MKSSMQMSALIMAGLFFSGTVAANERGGEVKTLILHFVHDAAEVEQLLKHLQEEARKLENDLKMYGNSVGIAAQLEHQVALNLKEKIAIDEKGPRLPMSAKEIADTVFHYECFKMKTYVS